MKSQKASILIGLLWCVAILSVVVVGALHSSTLELRITKNYGDRLQAHYLALAGIEKAKALLFLDARQRREDKNNHTGELYDAPSLFREVRLGRGQFSVLRQGTRKEGGGIVYGISDEESRINVNYASAEELGRLDGMQPELAASIIDYRDRDSNVSQGGAEAAEYAALQPPYIPRNQPLRTDRELLMVRGIDPSLFAGEDYNLNGLLDPEEDDSDDSFPEDNGDGYLQAGWSGVISTQSAIRDLDASGEARVNIQEADETELTQITGITSDIAQAIIQHRGRNEFQSIADLLEVRAAQPDQQNNAPQNQGPNIPPGQPSFPNPQSFPGGVPPNFAGQQPQPGVPPNASSAGNQQNTGPTVIDEQLFYEIADRVTVLATTQQAGPVNINTAPAEVLECLSGITPELAQNIINYRSSSGYFPNVAWLMKVDGVTQEMFKQLAPRIGVRSETFRILSEGTIPSTGARKRLQVMVRIGSSSVETLSFREDL